MSLPTPSTPLDQQDPENEPPAGFCCWKPVVVRFGLIVGWLILLVRFCANELGVCAREWRRAAQSPQGA